MVSHILDPEYKHDLKKVQYFVLVHIIGFRLLVIMFCHECLMSNKVNTIDWCQVIHYLEHRLFDT